MTINQTFDDLPTNFTYVAGSSKLKTSTNPYGVIDDPRITSDTVETNTFTEMRWDDPVTLGSQEKMFLEFMAVAPAIGAGLYCNEVYVKPGHRESRSGKTAKINVGASTSTLCFGPTNTVGKTGTPELIFANTTTYTYMISIVNEGIETIKIDRIYDYAPELFSYGGPVSSTPLSLNPGEPNVATVMKGGVTSTRLRWQHTGQNFWEILINTTWFIEYTGTATFPRGHYPSEIEVRFEDKQLLIHLSGPAAIITSLSIFRITVMAFTGYIYECAVWFANDVYIGDFEVVDGCSPI